MRSWEYEKKVNGKEFWRISSGKFKTVIVRNPSLGDIYYMQTTGWDDIPLSSPAKFPSLKEAKEGARLFVQKYGNALTNLRKSITEANNAD